MPKHHRHCEAGGRSKLMEQSTNKTNHKTTMTAPLQKQKVPKLRFGNFEDSWELKKLGDIGKVKMCKRIFSNETTEVGDIPFYKIGTFGKEPDAYITNERYLDYKKKFSFPNIGDILLSASGTLGRTVIYDGSPAYFQDSNIVWLDNNEKLITNSFLFNIYQIIKYDSEGGTIQRLYNSIISKAEFWKPSLPEQKKIATFLSAIDEKLEQLQAKKILLEAYKKGVIQLFFSQALRFKKEDGIDYPDWEEKRLGEIATKQSSKISANTISENIGAYKIYGATGLLQYVDFYNEEEEYISIVKDGAGVGRTLLCDKKSSVLGTLDIIKPKAKANLYFIYLLLNNIDFTKYITGSTIPHIYFKDYSKEMIKIPSLEEQTKIANFLSALDKKIALVTTQLENTQQFKKGLLQQMFV
jgi:type I restriction enzyme S subunit